MSQGYIQGGGDELPGTDIATGEKPGRETRGRDKGEGTGDGYTRRGQVVREKSAALTFCYCIFLIHFTVCSGYIL